MDQRPADADLSSADLARLLNSRCADPDLPCVTFEGRTWTGRQVRSATAVMAGALVEAGLRPGDIVATLCANRAELVPLMLAVWSTGAALAPLNSLLTPRERNVILEHLRPRLLVADDAWPPWADDPVATRSLCGGPPLEIVTRPSSSPARTAGAGTALILHTSGTTARPKAVELLAGNLIGGLESVLRLVRQAGTGGRPAPRRGAPNLVAFPLSHLAGVFNTLLALYNDRELLLMRRFEVEPFVELVERFRLPSVLLNPTMVHMLCDAPESVTERLASLRFVRSGSAGLSPTLGTRFFERFGAPVLNCYGQTETAGEVIGWTVPDLPRVAEKLGSVGRPHAGVGVRFVDEHLTDVPPGEVGELCVQAPFLMKGYLGADGDEAAYLDGGYLRTGDLGWIDGDGFVWLVGRLRDVVNCGGFKVLPEEVEEVLRSHPAVGDVMVAGVPDDRLGESPHAFVVLRPDGVSDANVEGLAAALIELAGRHLARYKVPRGVWVVNELPRTASGKLVRTRAAELLAGTEAAPVP